MQLRRFIRRRLVKAVAAAPGPPSVGNDSAGNKRKKPGQKTLVRRLSGACGSLLTRLAVCGGPGAAATIPITSRRYPPTHIIPNSSVGPTPSIRHCRAAAAKGSMPHSVPHCDSTRLHRSSVRYCRIVCLRHPMLCSSLGLRPPASPTGCGGLRPRYGLIPTPPMNP